MRKLVLGVATAAALLTAAAPAMAQIGVRVGPLGFGVGPGPSYSDCGYSNNCGGYYDYYGGPNVVVRGGGWHRGPAFHGRGHFHR
jgi:hypothetical protein